MRLKMEVLTMRDRVILGLLCLLDARHLWNAIWSRGYREVLWEGEPPQGGVP